MRKKDGQKQTAKETMRKKGDDRTKLGFRWHMGARSIALLDMHGCLFWSAKYK